LSAVAVSRQIHHTLSEPEVLELAFDMKYRSSAEMRRIPRYPYAILAQHECRTECRHTGLPK
jgi:hypothetical protein